MSKRKYSLEEKMAGLDLHGLPCRVPEPTPEQAKCSHTRKETGDFGYHDDWSGEWVSDWRTDEVSLMVDIEGTNNIRCTRCGYTRRY